MITREEAKELLPIMKAFAEGKQIQDKIEGLTGWVDTNEINLEFEGQKIQHRIKPEPIKTDTNYRSFKTAEECWQEMLKHQPFGWIKPTADSIPGKFMIINSIRINEVSITSGIDFTYNELLKYYVFVDGTLFGIKTEE